MSNAILFYLMNKMNFEFQVACGQNYDQVICIILWTSSCCYSIISYEFDTLWESSWRPEKRRERERNSGSFEVTNFSNWKYSTKLAFSTLTIKLCQY